MIENIKLTIAAKKGEIQMTNQEKFEGLKQQLLDENERQYGKEIRQKYGDEIVEHSYKKFNHLDEKAFNEMKQLESELCVVLSS